jgi:hypothetical protein
MSNESTPNVATMGIDVGKNSFHVRAPAVRSLVRRASNLTERICGPALPRAQKKSGSGCSRQGLIPISSP